ncbi:MAG: hypothetical protein QF904_02395 [Gemmatimonadota bacterium]|nr:hypothetical protein [Gemmatimonadota bacterium]
MKLCPRAWTTILAALAAALLVSTDLWPGLRGPETWQWARRAGGLSPSMVAVCGVLFAGTALLAVRVRRSWAGASRGKRAVDTGAAVALIALQMAVLTAAEPGGLSHIPRRVQDASFTSYHTISRDVEDVGDFLKSYHRKQGRFVVHGGSQPPGRVLFFHAVNRLAGNPERGAACAGALLLLLGALCVVPVLAMAGGGRHPGASGAAILGMATLPSYLLFTPETDHLLLLLVLTAAAMKFAALSSPSGTRPVALLFGAGLAGGAALFVSFTAIPALVAMGLAAAGAMNWRHMRGEALPSMAAMIRRMAAALAGLAIVPAWAAARGLDWIACYHEAAASAHRIQTLVLGRTFTEWVGWNLWDFALFAGWPLIALAMMAARSECAKFARSSADAREDGDHSAPWVLSALVVLLALDLSGRILGETGRIWVFFMPLLVLGLSAEARRWPDRAVLLLGSGQFVVVLSLKAFLNIPG